MKRNKKGQFVKKTTGIIFDGFGVWFDKKGYACICLCGKDIKLHRYNWEKTNGSIPKGFQLHHKDGIKGNWDIDNLEMLTQSDHLKIHAGWERKNGVWVGKPCKICKKLLPLKNFYNRKGLTPSNKCINCSLQENKDRLKNDMEFREKKRLYLKAYYKKNKDAILKQQRMKYREVAR